MEDTKNLTGRITPFRVDQKDKEELEALIQSDGNIGTIAAYMRRALKLYLSARRAAEQNPTG